MYLNRIHQIRDPVCYQHQVNCMILVCASVGISIYFSPVTSCCLLRTGCSTQRPILCPSCTWATSPCLAARPSGRADSPGGRSPPLVRPFYKHLPPSERQQLPVQRRGENCTHQPLSPPGLNHGTAVNCGDRNRPNSLYLCLSHISSEGLTAGLIMCVSLLWPLVRHVRTHCTHISRL